MAYAVYDRKKGERVYGRCGYTKKGRNGFLVHKDFRFQTLEQAKCYAQKLEMLFDYETKIKEVK